MEDNTRAHELLIEHVNMLLLKTPACNAFTVLQGREILVSYQVSKGSQVFALTGFNLGEVTLEMTLLAFMNAVEWCIDLLANQLGRNLLGLGE